MITLHKHLVTKKMPCLQGFMCFNMMLTSSDKKDALLARIYVFQYDVTVLYAILC
jgi:hypothetical protein